MKLLDSNIIIYSANPKFSYIRPLIMDTTNAVSSITLVETLGYFDLNPFDKRYFESVFQVLQILDLEPSIIQKAIEVRQQHKMKLGDSLIAATALTHQCELYTRNISDFQKIQELTVVNPIK